MSLSITGWSIITAAGIGARDFTPPDTAAPPPTPTAASGAASAVSAAAAASGGASGSSDAGAAPADPLPSPQARTLGEIDARRILGRRGTASLDRRTILALIACRDALADAGIQVDDATRHRIGVALGTTWGSLKAMSDYTKDSLLEERPYLVEPSRFPNTVMNCASGQAAIWYGLKGVNATVAGGPLAFLHALHYTSNLLRRGYADTILAGAVEEFTSHLAWADHLMADARPAVPPGEAAGVFVVERPADAQAAGRRIDAEIAAVAVAFAPGGIAGGDMRKALEGCVRRALQGAAISACDVAVAATCAGVDDAIEGGALDAVFAARQPRRIAVRAQVGNCYAAMGAMQAGALIAGYLDRSIPADKASLITGWTTDGGVGAAILRGGAGGGADRL